MDRDGVSKSARSHRARKPTGRRPRTVKLTERDGYWHASGTLIASGRTARIRKSLGLPVASTSYRQAEIALAEYLDDEKARLSGQAGRGDSVAVAALGYLTAPRARPLGASTVRIVKEIKDRFDGRRLNAISADDWRGWVDERNAGRKSETRERFLNGVIGFLNFARRNHGLSRVSSILYGVRLCDLNLGKGREQIIFRGTKNGEDVTAALNPTAVAILKDYLNWRGKLSDREAPLFLTYRRKPYTDNGRAYGGQNKTAFKAARRRAIAAIWDAAEANAVRLSALGQKEADCASWASGLCQLN
jgi:hypothetical protein